MKAIVCTYLPDEDRVLHTPFEGPGCVDKARAFRKGEEERNDFPGAIWGIIADEEAREDAGERFVNRVMGRS